LLAKKGMFAKAITEKLLTYAIGRGTEPTDHCDVAGMADTLAAKGYRFSALVEQIVLSDAFRKRRTAPGDVAPLKRVARADDAHGNTRSKP